MTTRIAWVVVVAALGGVAVDASARMRGATIPILIRAIVCEEASSGCPRADETLRLLVDGRERRIGFTKLVVMTGSVSTGEIYAALRPRPVRLFGPQEELGKLAPGKPLEMQAVLRPGTAYLFLESLAVPKEDTGR